MPSARPLVTTKPRRARLAAKAAAFSRPCGEGLRLPTMASWAVSSTSGSPSTHNTSGGDGVSRRRAGKRGSSRVRAWRLGSPSSQARSASASGAACRWSQALADRPAAVKRLRGAWTMASAEPQAASSLRKPAWPRPGVRARVSQARRAVDMG